MKVLHVNTHMNIGGIGQYITTLAKALKARNIDCIIASSGGDLEKELKNSDIKHIYMNLDTKFEFSPRVISSAFSLAKIVKEESIDIIHAHSRVSQAASTLASRKTGVPHVSTCHGFFKKRLSRALFDTWGVRVIAISDAVKSHLEKDFDIDERRVKLIYTGIDINKFSKSYSSEEIAGIRRSVGLKEGSVAGTMGRLSPVKGQRFLVEAMKHVISKKKDAQCLIIGRGTEEKNLKNLSRRLGIAESINFIGSTHIDTPSYLSCMDIFVLPSVNEGLGLALLEAMAAGRPCIASKVGGISDIIKDGVNGLLVPAGDTNGIAFAILKLLDERVLSLEMGRKAKEFVKGNFSIDLMADKVIKLYEEVIGGK